MTEDLSKLVFKSLDFDYGPIKECVENSFKEKGNYQSENTILKEDEKWRNLMAIHKHPAISINNQTYQGDFTGADIARAICASYQRRPDFCIDERISKMAEESFFSDLEELGLDGDYSSGHLIVIGVFIVLLNMGLVYLHKKHN